jgi:hypothetical protein
VLSVVAYLALTMALVFGYLAFRSFAHVRAPAPLSPVSPRFVPTAIWRKPRDFARLLCLELKNLGGSATFSADMRIRRYALGPIELGWGYEAAAKKRVAQGQTAVVNVGWMESGPDLAWTFYPLRPDLSPDGDYQTHNPQVFSGGSPEMVEIEVFDENEKVQKVTAEVGYGGLADAVVIWRLT